MSTFQRQHQTVTTKQPRATRTFSRNTPFVAKFDVRFGLRGFRHRTESGITLNLFSPRIEAFLRYLSGSKLVAEVVPPVIRTGPAAWLAVAVTLSTMLVTRKPLLSLVLGIATAGYCAILAEY